MHFNEEVYKGAMGGLGGIVLGGVALYYGLRSRRRSMKLKSIPLFNPRFPKPGPAKIKGKVSPGSDAPLKAPLSGRECVYYDYTIERVKTKGRLVTLVEKKRTSVPFYIETADGKLLVEPKDMEVSFDDIFIHNVLFDEEPSAEIKALLELNGINLTNLLGFNKRMLIIGQTIPLEREVVACGAVERRGFEYIMCKGSQDPDMVLISSDDDEFAGHAGFEAKLCIYIGAVLIAFGIGYALIKLFA